MARPQKLTLDFFLHDASARNDRKMKSLRRKHGNDGYASYFCLLEILCHESGLGLNLNNSLDLETVIEECGLRDEAHFYKILQTCIDLGLFDKQLWESERIVFSHNLYNSYLKRLEERKNAAIRQKRKKDANSLQSRISAVESSVITRDNSVKTELSRDFPFPEDQNTELKDQNTEKKDPDPVPWEMKTASTNPAGDKSPGGREIELGENDAMAKSGLADRAAQTPTEHADHLHHGKDIAPSASATGEVKQSETTSNGRGKGKGKKSQDEPSGYPDAFLKWWKVYYEFCQQVSSGERLISPGKKQQAFTAWRNLFPDGVPTQDFLDGDAAYRRVKVAEFQKRGEAMAVSHACRYLQPADEDPKWKQALDFVRRKEKPNDPNHINRGEVTAEQWAYFVEVASRYHLVIEEKSSWVGMFHIRSERIPAYKEMIRYDVAILEKYLASWTSIRNFKFGVNQCNPQNIPV